MNFPFLEAKARLIRIMGTFDLATGHADTFDELLDSLESELRDVLGYYRESLKQHLIEEPVAMLERDPRIGRLRVTYEDAVTELEVGVYPLYVKPQGWRDNVAQAYLKGFDEGCKSILEKNQIEPVAYLTKRKIGGTEGLLRADMVDRSAKNQETHDFIPLYTAPPKREWVGLTDEEIKSICDEWKIMYGGYLDGFAKFTESKLKEKNT